MLGTLLDPITGRPEPGVLLGPSGLPVQVEQNIANGWDYGNRDDKAYERAMNRAPQSVLDLLERAEHESKQIDILRRMGIQARPMMGAGQSWEMLEYVTIATATQIANTTTETIMVPDFSFTPGWFSQGRPVRYTVFGDMSTVITTPGTATARLRWGGVAGTSLAASGAFAPDPTAASTNVSVMFQWYNTCRSSGTAGSMFCMGLAIWNDYDDASATTIVGNLNMSLMPVSAPAVTSSINTVSANALSPTMAFSVATSGTNFQSHLAFLESLN